MDWQNKGVIDVPNDVDMFVFHTEAGAIELSVWPAWDAFYRTSKRGANLDVRAVLRDRYGNEIAASDPSTDTDASIATSVALPGDYYLEVSGVGNGNYTDYASAGQYFIAGAVAVEGVANVPPTADFGHACAQLTCSFSDASSDNDGSIAAYAWDFGDGASSTPGIRVTPTRPAASTASP